VFRGHVSSSPPRKRAATRLRVEHHITTLGKFVLFETVASSAPLRDRLGARDNRSHHELDGWSDRGRSRTIAPKEDEPMPQLTRITRDARVMGGKPCIRGMDTLTLKPRTSPRPPA
jgi:hypothetical protein